MKGGFWEKWTKLKLSRGRGGVWGKIDICDHIFLWKRNLKNKNKMSFIFVTHFIFILIFCIVKFTMFSFVQGLGRGFIIWAIFDQWEGRDLKLAILFDIVYVWPLELLTQIVAYHSMLPLHNEFIFELAHLGVNIPKKIFHANFICLL